MILPLRDSNMHNEPTLALPTLSSLNVSPETLGKYSVDAAEVSNKWVQAFNSVFRSPNATPADVVSLFEPNGWWRDILALTWDFRSFHGHDRIAKFIGDRILSGVAGLKDVTVASGEGMTPVFLKPAPDLAWVQFFITFSTSSGTGTGVVRVVPRIDSASSGITWKAFALLTTLTELEGHPEQIGKLRNPLPNHGFWPSNREQELEFRDREPAVVVVGAGQSGLDVAARLKVLGVDTLVVEKHIAPGAVSF